MFALLFVLLRNRTWSIIMLAVTAINVWPVAPWYLIDTQPDKTAGSHIKLLHANAYSGNDNTQALLDLVAAENPDIIFLQEFTARWKAAVAPLADDYPYGGQLARESNFGIAVLSQKPVLTSAIQSPPLGLETLIVGKEVGDRHITIVSTHPMPPLGRDGFEARNEQLDHIAEEMNSIDAPRILIGDLNSSMWAHHYAELVESTGLTNARAGFGVLPTWPTNIPIAMIPIDHCLVSEDVTVLDMRTGPDIGSDHLPLIVELGLQ